MSSDEPNPHFSFKLLSTTIFILFLLLLLLSSLPFLSFSLSLSQAKRMQKIEPLYFPPSSSFLPLFLY